MRINLSLLLVLFLTACATPLPPEVTSNIKTIEIYNEFEETPTWTIIGTTVFTNSSSVAEIEGVKSTVTRIVNDYFSSKNYTVSETEGAKSADSSTADLIIKIVPREAAGLVNTYGYGFYERSFMGTKRGPHAYIAVNLVPYISSNGKLKPIGGTYYDEGYEDLPIEDMVATWGEVSEEQKTELVDKLNTVIERSLSRLLPKLGL